SINISPRPTSRNSAPPDSTSRFTLWRRVFGILFNLYGARSDSLRPVAAGFARRTRDTDGDRPRRARLCRASGGRPRASVLYDDDPLGWVRHVAESGCRGISPGAWRGMAGGGLGAG